ncbi:MAG: nicotinate phosphoribosyltransferase [Actinobacteria bacterium]|nr:MAG: nicotinate phosphoribosyltransferase [Actinomycetota bacterium]
MPFHTASDKEIKDGKITDVYFERGKNILEGKGIKKNVVAEIRAAVLPDDWSWAVLGGVEEAVRLFEGLPVNCRSLPEGTVFEEEVPVFWIEGEYTSWAVYETAVLGFLCQASGIVTKAARCKIAAEERQIYSFGARRMHPAIAPMIERAAYIGGVDGVATTAAAKLIGEMPIGTMSHSIILVFGNETEAFKAFNEVIEPSVKRVALVDTFNDEKFASISAAEALGKDLYAVRLDTPSSRRGDFYKILQEVRWELDTRGYSHVKIFISGGLDEYEIEELNDYADAYGVGTAISAADVVDFSLDIVEVEGKPFAKRGKMSGSKEVYRCDACFEMTVLPIKEDPGVCSCKEGIFEKTSKEVVKQGKVLELPPAKVIREYTMSQFEYLDIDEDLELEIEEFDEE